ERAERSGDRERRQEPLPEVVERVPLPAQDRREVDDQRELRQLGRLERHRPEPDPSARPVDRLADGRDEHEDEQRDRYDQERQHEPLEPPVVHAERDPEARGAEQRQAELPLEEEVGVVEAVARDDRARRIDHHHTNREEHDGDAEKPEVGCELPRHLSGLGGSDRRSSPRPPQRDRASHQSNLSTSFLKTSPRCSKFSNMSNEAHAGESSTTSPGMARRRAASTAPSSDGQRVTGIDAALNAAASFGASSPIRNAWPTRPRAAAASGSKSCPLPRPPAINRTRSEKLSSALRVDATLVPFESLKYCTPRRSRTNSIRCATPRNRPIARRIVSGASPTHSTQAVAASTFSTLCAPRRKISATGQISSTWPSGWNPSACAASGVPILPATSTGRGCPASKAPVSAVVVVLPLVPVIAIVSASSARQPSSSSPMIGTRWARAGAS